MRNKDKWIHSKFVYRQGKLIASRNRKELRIGSRLIADIIAKYYDTNIRKYAKGRLIDLGCGKVPFFEAYRDYITENICIDWKKNEYSDCECDLNSSLPFNDGEFDTIILSDVLEHISQPENLWKEMARVLVAGGKVLMNTPFYYWLHDTPYDYYRYTEYALQRFAELTGFKIIFLKPIGGAPEVLADILAKYLQFVPIIGKYLANITQSVARIFLKTNLGKKISEETSESFPLGYFLVAEKIDKEL